jgi:hypothetical protein
MPPRRRASERAREREGERRERKIEREKIARDPFGSRWS